MGMQRLKDLLHGAINCINTQLKLTKRAIDCSSLQFLVSQHVLKFIAQTSNLSQRCQRHDSPLAERMCDDAPAPSEDSHFYAITHYYMIMYSHIVLINLNLGHSFILRKGGKANRTFLPRLRLI